VSGKRVIAHAVVLFKKDYNTLTMSQVNISSPEDGWHEEWVSDDFMALPELVAVLYENQQYNPKLQYLTGVARDDASYLLCKEHVRNGCEISIFFLSIVGLVNRTRNLTQKRTIIS
jgi:hypothetical protein